MKRCTWCIGNKLYEKYHDEEWGAPIHDDRKLFEMLVLEGAQAGLSWLTVLKKRDSYRQAFDNFDPTVIAAYDENKIKELVNNQGIIRNRLKIKSAINNAQQFLHVQKEYSSFGSYIWGFIDNKPIINRWETISQIPSTTPQSDQISKDLKKRGFTFIGSTIIYAYMQSIGMVNDHTVDCFRYPELTS